ncbi:uncharacterized protein LOC124655177 [Lolium rigidum]|uniref:uncharacterized protein LOC124655177 n=1 Tax=Lolium rigidum TaxID=89674 RepID=UPI001F5D487C|nr:uncharacterized protein LOC124655177 [Lolium rigidum]
MAGERRVRRMIVDGLDHMDRRPEGIQHNKSVALDHIHDYYKKALDRLPPELIPSLLEAGFCFGFLDPVSNIISSTVSHELGKGKKGKRPRRATSSTKKSTIEAENRRTRYKTISQIIESSKDFSMAPNRSKSEGAGIAVRSLRGLATFLTSYFRYLTIQDALRYLRLSKADLLVAVHLIQEDYCSTYTFTIHDMTAKIALGCAATSAMHPGVPAFVCTSLLLASHVDEVSNLLPTKGCIGHSTIKRLSELFTLTNDMIDDDPRRPMQHAISRMQRCRKKKTTVVPAGLDYSLKLLLLDKIHVLYLKAISRIPRHELCSRHHRGLLKAGHCYGPFDPVTNIILSTIWYDTVFPAEREFEVQMISTKKLARIECLSLEGLVAYVCALFPALSTYQAMRYLLINNVQLDMVIMRAKEDGHDQRFPFSQSEAFDDASLAACHPSPTKLVEFATTVMPVMGETLRSTLKVNRMLSSSDVCAISETLSQKFPPSKSPKLVPDLNMHASNIIAGKRMKFKAFQSAIVKRVKAALLRYAQRVGQEYELHVICDVNAEIPEHGICYIPGDYKYPFSHVNILAKRKGSQIADADAVPTLFFIECSNIDEDMASLCCPILEPSKDAGRCFHCECEGIKIIHPPSETYHGRCTEFEDMASGKNPVSNEELISQGKYGTLFIDTMEDDCVYFDSAWDGDFAVSINEMERDRDEEEVFSWLEKKTQELKAYNKGLFVNS